MSFFLVKLNLKGLQIKHLALALWRDMTPLLVGWWWWGDISVLFTKHSTEGELIGCLAWLVTG